MTHPILPRRLWHETKDGRLFVEQADLIGRPEPLIVLGEAGMGKTALLGWLGEHEGYAFCTARQLMNVRPDPRRLLGNATTLVVDALDELSVRGEGDAVDLVLQKLGDAGYPRLVVSCRIADWRNATGVSAISEQYPDVDLLVLHLEPLTDDEILQFLVSEFDGDAAKAEGVVSHFTHRNLDGMLGNPQTLDMVARVAKAGPLPETKAGLFGHAVELLRKEHSDSKADLQPDEATALHAAGAAFAALILTGSDALVIESADPDEGEIRLAEVAALPGAHKLGTVLGSRLFAGSANRFSYCHRRIGEYLGSRWLARQADTAMKRKRFLALFQSHGVVPASLRGLHAWLAHHDPGLAPDVIAADPMGVIEYGDADELGSALARLLLEALQKLADRNPRFWDWQSYSLKSVVQPELLADVRALITDPDTQFGLRLLLIEAVKNSPVAEALRPDLRRILLDRGGDPAHRSRAIDALAALGGEDWPSIVDTLRGAADDNAVSLALEIVEKVGVEPFDDAVIIGLAITQAKREDRVLGLFTRLQRAIPEPRLDSLLDVLVDQIAALGNRYERPGNYELTDLGYQLIARRLAAGTVDAARLWSWLKPFEAEIGYHRSTREKVHKLIRDDNRLRGAVQRLVLLDEPGPKTVWQRAWRLTSRSGGLAPTPEDVIELLGALDPAERDDKKWRDLLLLIPHSATEGAEVRAAAKRIVANRPDMLAWIDKLADPRVPKRQIKREKKKRRRKAKRAMQWKEQRERFAKEIEAMRRGEFRTVIRPARAYLGVYRDFDEELTPHGRLTEWLGEDLAQAAFEGFEAFLQSDQPPTARQMAESYAESVGWNTTPIIVAALAERVRHRMGFDGVSDDRLTTGFYELQHNRLDSHAKLEELKPAVEAEMHARDLMETAIRNWIEPQLEHGRPHVDQLYALMRGTDGESRAADLATEWLTRFPDMASDPEEEMIDRLIASRRFDTLRRIAKARLAMSLSEARRRNWDAVAFLTDFEAQRGRLASVAAADPNWIWTLRERVASDRSRSPSVPLSIEQLVWLMTTFRRVFPSVSRPSGVTSGDTNPWDASEFIASAARRLADMTSDDAIAALSALRDASPDGYTDYLRALSAEQQRKHAEGRYRPPLLGDVRAIVEAKPPRTVADLQATLLELLDQVQRRIRADPADPWRGFYTDAGTPHDEERCRDHLLTMLGPRPESIELLPEGHLADDNRADIIASLSGMRSPIEVKGQWHSELWRAADTQLDRLYATDYAAERRGIYLVLWFGHHVAESKKPKAPGRGRRRPMTPEELREGLIVASHAAQDGRVAVVVLDLTRSPSG